jgi:hypothetical protein
MSPVLGPLAARAAAVRWRALYSAGVWLLSKGRQFWSNLSDAERGELRTLLSASRGRRSNLSDAQFARAKELVRKGFSGPGV